MLSPLWRADALGAQAVRGEVFMPDGRTPAAGVVVVLEDAQGAVVGRALTDERGGISLALLSGGRFTVRALRIGYRPTVLPPFNVEPTGVTALRLVLDGTAVALPSVTVRGDDICRGQREAGDDGGRVVADVWEEARKALLASGLSADITPLMAEWIEYERTLDPTARFVRAQRVHTTRTATTHAFRSAPSAQLAANGYVIDTDDGTIFHAPDAEVLLSDSFAALHCFHVEPPGPDRAQLIGVGFRPARERRRVADIEGTFWIDRATSELRSLEYRYTNLPAVTERVQPGGVVEFLRLASGSWLVSRWSIRMPQLAVSAPTTMRRRGITVTGTPTAVQLVRVVGGEVSTVARGERMLYRARGATLAVQVTSPDTLVSAANARITLDGTDYTLIVDAAGRGALSPVLPGDYRVRVQTPLMDSLGVLAEPVHVTVHDDNPRTTASTPTSSPGSVTALSVPRVAVMLASRCGAAARVEQGAHVRGVVVDSVGLPVADAAVRLSWQQQIAIVHDQLLWNEQSAAVRSDSLGNWQLCAVPRDVGITVRAESPAGVGRSALRIAPGVAFAASRLTVRPVVAVAGTLTNEAFVTVLVTDSVARPVRDAVVVVTTPVGAPQRLRTDTAGRVTIARAVPGEWTVEVRKVGFLSGTLTADVERGENRLPVVLRASSVPQLSAMRVLGDRTVNARHREFERRRERGDATATITADEVARRLPASTWQLLTRVPSLQLLDSAGYVYARSTRMSTVLCWPRLSIDGQVIAGRPNLAMMPPPSEIFGIEIFAGSASLPLPSGGEGDERFCGLIAVWTK